MALGRQRWPPSPANAVSPAIVLLHGLPSSNGQGMAGHAPSVYDRSGRCPRSREQQVRRLTALCIAMPQHVCLLLTPITL